jgi:NAD(P)-dependent dehydrogenase (short-subunit alcohol dehydrogenase family)
MKKAIVIGATSGIGRGLAKILTENGNTVGSVCDQMLATHRSDFESHTPAYL